MLRLHSHKTVGRLEGVAARLSVRHYGRGRHHVATEVVVPRTVAYVFLRHHTVPLALAHHLIIIVAEHRVALEALLHPVCPQVGIRAALLRHLPVHGLRIIHVIEVGHSLHRKQDQLPVGIMLLLGQLVEEAQGAHLQPRIVISHLLPLARLHIIRLRVEHLWGHAAHILAVLVVDRGGFPGSRTAEHTGEEMLRVVGHVLLGVCLRVPGHIHEELNGILHRLEVAHIENPHALDAVIIGQRQLLEHLLCLRHIQPLGVARCTHIVHMVVDAPATRVLAFLLIDRHPANVAPVVVAHQHDHIVGHTEARIVVVLHLLIEGPHLRGLVGRFARHLFDYLPLVLHNALHQLRVGRLAHRLVTVAAHTYGHHILGALHALDALAEELVQTLLIGLIVPRPPLPAVAGILLMVACHRLMMTGAHHHSHAVGQFAVLRVVGIERPSPHGGPHHISLQAQDQLKDLLVEAMVAIVGAEGVLHPRGETGRLIVEEDAAKLHSRFAIGEHPFPDVCLLMFLNGNVSPEIPGRDAQLPTQLIDAIDGTPPVAACNHQFFAHGGDDEFLAFALQVGQPQLIDVFIFTYGTNQDVCLIHAQSVLKVGLQVADGHLHPFIVGFAIPDGALCKAHGIRLWCKHHELFCATCHCCTRQHQQR